MCGRFYIEIDEAELQDIVREAEKNVPKSHEQLTLKTNGEIFPTDAVAVQVGAKRFLPMKWGFTGFNAKPVINARSETALEKPMFRKPMQEQRCLIPASGYYEWKKDGAKKIKYQISVPGSPMYFAGCWRQEKGGLLYTFVILTRPAAGGVEALHDRMPVIIPRSRIDDWLTAGTDALGHAVTALSFSPASDAS